MSFFTKIPINRLIQVLLKGSYGGQNIRNVFWYVLEDVITSYTSEEGLALLKSIAEAFDADIWKSELNSTISSGFGNVSIEAIASDPTQPAYWKPGVRAEVISAEGGTGPAEAMASFDAWGYRLRPVSPSLVRIGQKRFVGVPEIFSNFGTISPSGLTEMELVCDEFETPLNVVDPTISSPNAYMMIPKTFNNGTEIDPDYRVDGAYRLQEATPHIYVRSQVSRQRGRGT